MSGGAVFAPPSRAAAAHRGLVKWFGDTFALDELSLDVPARSCFGLVGSQRQRQVDHAAVGDRARATGRRRDRGVRARHRHRRACGATHDGRGARPAAAVRAAHRPRVPGDDGRAAPDGARRRPRAHRRAARTRCNSPTTPIARSPGTATACARRPRSRRRCCTGRACCCSTSRSRESIPLSARTMRAMLDRFRSGGGTVVLSSHVMDLVERLCDHVGVIHHGRVVATGPTAAAAQRAPARGRLHRRRRRVRRPTPTPSPGWAEVMRPLVHAFVRLRWRLLRGAIRHGGAEQVGAVASLVASAMIGIGVGAAVPASRGRTSEHADDLSVIFCTVFVICHARASASSPASPSRSIPRVRRTRTAHRSRERRVGLLAASAFGPPGLAGIAITVGSWPG